MTYRTRRAAINSLMRAQDELSKVAKWVAPEGQTGEELSIDLTAVVTALREAIDTIRNLGATYR